ncbi:uncharacterized protein [Dysidea avara]
MVNNMRMGINQSGSSCAQSFGSVGTSSHSSNVVDNKSGNNSLPLQLQQDSNRASQHSPITNGSVQSAKKKTPMHERTSNEVTMNAESEFNAATADVQPQLQKDSTRESKRSTISNESVKSATPIEATTPVHEANEGTADEVTLTVETFGTQHMQQSSNDQASADEYTATVPKLIDTASIANDYTALFEVPCTCQQQLLPLIQNNQVHLIFTSQTTGRRLSVGNKRLQGYMENYSLVNDSEDKKTFSNCKKCVCPTVVLYLNKVTILGGSSDAGSTFKLGLYQFTPKSYYSSWEPVVNSKFFPLQFELKNSLCISYGNDEIVAVSVSTKLIQAEFTLSLVLHLFSPTPIAGKYWRSTTVPLPNAQCCDGRYKIQSGIILENNLYCSLLLQGTKVLVCKVDLSPLQQSGKEAYDVSHSWSLSDSLLCDCFLSLFSGEVVAVTFKNVDDKTVMEVRQSSNYFTSSLEYQFEFPSLVKARSVADVVIPEIPHTLVVVYHDIKSNKCFVKKFYIYQ